MGSLLSFYTSEKLGHRYCRLQDERIKEWKEQESTNWEWKWNWKIETKAQKHKKDPIVFRKLQEEEKGYLLIVYCMCEQEMLWSRRPEARVWEVHQERMKALMSRYQQHRRTQPSSSRSRAGMISCGHLICHRLHRFYSSAKRGVPPSYHLSLSLSLSR